MTPTPPPDSLPPVSHADLELTRRCEEAGYVYHDGWFVDRRHRADLSVLLAHPRPPRPFPLGPRLLAEARSFAALGWLFGLGAVLWGALTADPVAAGLGGLVWLMMGLFLLRSTRALRQGRLLQGRVHKVVQRATLITSTLDRVAVTLHPADPWPEAEVNVPPRPSRHLLDRCDGYEVLLLSGGGVQDVQLMGMRPGTEPRDGTE